MKHTLLALVLCATPVYAQEVMLNCGDTWAVYWNKYNNYISVRGTDQQTRTVWQYTIDSYDLRLTIETNNTVEQWEIDRVSQRASYSVYENSRLIRNDSLMCIQSR